MRLKSVFGYYAMHQDTNRRMSIRIIITKLLFLYNSKHNIIQYSQCLIHNNNNYQHMKRGAKRAIAPITIPDQMDDELPQIKTINSTKNLHELKKFVFPNVQIDTGRAARQDKLRKLQKQKQQLLDSLHILKNGALSCIIEKDETIMRLRNQVDQAPQKCRSLEDEELENLLTYIKDLEEQYELLKQELCEQKKSFDHELYERQSYIDELQAELNWSGQRMAKLQHYDELLHHKIKIMEQDNENLSFMLNQSQQTLNKHKKQLEPEQQGYKSQESLGCNWSVSDVNARFDHSKDQRQLSYSLMHSMDSQIASEKIKQLQKQHEIQIMDLTHFYESRIETLKNMCQKNYDTLPIVNNYPCRQELPDHSNILQNCSVNSGRSGRSGRSGQLSREVMKLQKNMSTLSFRSQNDNLNMETIDEREQMLSPRKSLKEELKFMDIENLSRKTSGRRLKYEVDSVVSGVSDSNSQHSYRVYQPPAFKKDKDKYKPSDRWSNFLWFTFGTIAGGSLLTVSNKIFK